MRSATCTALAAAMGIAFVQAAPAPASQRGHAQMLPDCMQAGLHVESDIDPRLQVFEAEFRNACDPDAEIRGIAELWVDDVLVEFAPVDSRGRARLQHLRGGLAPTACVAFRGEQIQTCEHGVKDTPGHQKHALREPVEMRRCEIIEMP